ncbi:MAG: DUF2190 family protein [Allosphingosinicella sp.]|uniref:DUF2190 family protein n=1 Tax=Allosphingosinicella sp. TaxID=2823234 RepID=UPI00395F4950
MKNFVQEGVSLDWTAPAGGVTAGKAVKIGAAIVMPATDAAEGERFAGWVEGVYEVDKATGAAWAEGDALYLLADGSAFTKTASGNTKAGYAVVPEGYTAPASGAAKGLIRLVPTI